MSKINLTKIPFSGTAEQEKKLRARLAETKKMRGGLMPSLQQAQEIYGYLPIEVQKIVAEELNVSMEEVFGVVTFYSQFTLNPQGEYRISVCIGTACYVRGAGEVLDALTQLLEIEPGECTADGKFSLEATRCLGCCGLSPVMTINGRVYGKMNKEEVIKVLRPYLDKK